jgi:hypothetical protein
MIEFGDRGCVIIGLLNFYITCRHTVYNVLIN